MFGLVLFMSLFTSATAFSAIHTQCLPGTEKVTGKVTHYYVPLLEQFNDFVCNKMEGTCIYRKNKVLWLHNYGYEDEPLSQARCKNGYGNRANCLNPCRTIAASMKHHKFGEIVFIKGLVGKKCGNKARDGFEMVHDGFVMIADTGSPKHFNSEGRFDFFWGRCRNRKNGICREGALNLSEPATNSPYCLIYDPNQPERNAQIRARFFEKVRKEAQNRKDSGAVEELMPR